MSNKSGRRSFIKNISIGGVSAGILPAVSINAATQEETDEKQIPDNKTGTRTYNSSYTGSNLNRVAFPIGGLGAGMFCMEGTGAISHMSIRNQPDIFNEPGLFAAIAIKGLKNGAKVLEGPVPDWKKFGQRDAGNGLGGATTGLPHFHNASFLPRFPFAQLELSDKDLPLKIKITGWSPFIPGEEDNSSLPVGAMEYQFTNTGTSSLDCIFSFNGKNFVTIDKGRNSIKPYTNGFILSEAGTIEKPISTEFAVFTNDSKTVVDHCWFRGGWWDPITMAWNSVKSAELKNIPAVDANAPGASLYVPFKLAVGKEKTIRLMMAWYTPDSDYTYGEKGMRKENCDPANGCCNSPSDI